MLIMKIKSGDYLKSFENEEYKYFLVLEVNEKNVEITRYNGSPFSDDTVFDWKEVVDGGFSIELISESNIEKKTIYTKYVKNNLSRAYASSTCYIWKNLNGITKEKVIPISQRYFDGHEWKEITEGFFDES